MIFRSRALPALFLSLSFFFLWISLSVSLSLSLPLSFFLCDLQQGAAQLLQGCFEAASRWTRWTCCPRRLPLGASPWAVQGAFPGVPELALELAQRLRRALATMAAERRGGLSGARRRQAERVSAQPGMEHRHLYVQMLFVHSDVIVYLSCRSASLEFATLHCRLRSLCVT